MKAEEWRLVFGAHGDRNRRRKGVGPGTVSRTRGKRGDSKREEKEENEERKSPALGFLKGRMKMEGAKRMFWETQKVK